MYIKKCPKCGRLPKIENCISTTYRRKICYDPCYSSKLNRLTLAKHNCIEDWPWNTSWFIFIDEGDDNTIYKIWNEALIDE